MPLPERARRASTDRTLKTSRMHPAGPLAITGVALIVLTVLWKTTTPVAAIIMAVAALLAGAFLLVLIHGTGRRHRRTRSSGLWRHR